MQLRDIGRDSTWGMQMILVDSRVGSADLAEHPLLDRISVLTTLPSADVSFIGNGQHGQISVGIELKSIHDLLQSIGSGRLQGQDGQIQRMIKSYDVCWLLYYGEYKAAQFNNLYVRVGRRFERYPRPFSYLESLLMGLQDIGVRVSHAYDKESAVAWIAACYKRYRKPWESHKSFRVLNVDQKITKSSSGSLVGDLIAAGIDADCLQRMKTAASLPNVRYERSLAIARRFKSIRAMMVADEEEWGEIDGIGKVIARNVVRVIRRKGQ
jgi:ERCC4-type nuclease